MNVVRVRRSLACEDGDSTNGVCGFGSSPFGFWPGSLPSRLAIRLTLRRGRRVRNRVTGPSLIAPGYGPAAP